MTIDTITWLQIRALRDAGDSATVRDCEAILSESRGHDTPRDLYDAAGDMPGIGSDISSGLDRLVKVAGS